MRSADCGILFVVTIWSVAGCGAEHEPPQADADAIAVDPSEPDRATLASPMQEGTLLQLPDGPIKGRGTKKTRSFIGIPYAAPPVGALRWQPPHPVEPWSEPIDVSGPGVACIQPGDPASGVVAQSEDCLQLNVYAPATPGAEPVPVMVWLHGGDNITGSANGYLPPVPLLAGHEPPPARLYDGAAFRDYAEREVVVVTVNYRLGSLGFLSHPELTQEQGASGNYGLLDQQAALHWVQRNIRAFGGDPKRVTLFGQAAGAEDVCHQLLARDARGLFHAAVLQSGSCGTKSLRDLASAEAEGVELSRESGCESLECLRALPADHFAQFGGAGPILDGSSWTEQPTAAIAAGDFAHVPLIVGNVATLDDATFGCPARWLARSASRFAPVFLYSLERETWLTSVETVDRDSLWVWNVWPAISPYTADETAISVKLRGYWTQLVEGDANTEQPPRWERPYWPRYDADHEVELVIGSNLTTAAMRRTDRCASLDAATY